MNFIKNIVRLKNLAIFSLFLICFVLLLTIVKKKRSGEIWRKLLILL